MDAAFRGTFQKDGTNPFPSFPLRYMMALTSIIDMIDGVMVPF